MSNSEVFNQTSQVNNDQDASLKRDRLLTNESFQRLRQFQEEIFSISEMTPSFRKLINALITEQNLKELKSKFLKEIDV